MISSIGMRRSPVLAGTGIAERRIEESAAISPISKTFVAKSIPGEMLAMAFVAEPVASDISSIVFLAVFGCFLDETASAAVVSES